MSKNTARSTILAFTLVACATEPPGYDPDWNGESFVSGGKADGLLDIAPEIEQGTPVTGVVGGDQVNVYSVRLNAGAEYLFEETVTSGDLNPHISLFWGTSQYIRSVRWELDGNVLRKWYVADHTGVHLVALRAYRGMGSGDYSLTMRCASGECELLEAMTKDEVASCVRQARECAFARMGRYGGRVGPVRAQVLFDECLDEARLGDGFLCDGACTMEGLGHYSTPQDLCESVVAALPYWADQSSECIEVLDGCMSTCYALEDEWSRDEGNLWDTAEWSCWAFGEHASCNDYAEGHASCGGSYTEDTDGGCHALCLSTIGAWGDDLDDYCDRQCGRQMCTDLENECTHTCSGVTNRRVCRLECLARVLDAYTEEDC